MEARRSLASQNFYFFQLSNPTGKSFSFPIILEKVLELVSVELTSSCAHL